MTDSLRTRIAAALWNYACPDKLKADYPEPGKAFLYMADAVIRELDTVLVDFGLWLSEELCGEPMSRRDLESCLADWKEGGVDE